MQIVNPASRFKRLMARRGGVQFTYIARRAKRARTPSTNKLGRCTLRLLNPAEHDTTMQRWFGTIIERDGRFKFVSYANQF